MDLGLAAGCRYK